MNDFRLALIGGLIEEARRRGMDLREVRKPIGRSDFSLMVREFGYLDVGCWVQDDCVLYCEVYAGKWRDAFNMAWFDLKDPGVFTSVVLWFRESLV